MKSILLIIFSTLILSCASAPRSAKTFTEAPIGVPNKEKSVLVLYRKTVPPVMYTVKALVDGTLVAKLPNKAFTWSYVEPGKHEVKFTWPTLALIPGHKEILDVEAGRYYFVELGGDMGYSVGTAYTVHGVTSGTYEEKSNDVISCCKFVPPKI